MANILKIMVATDNHLGYLEKDPIRKNDSFMAFEEVLASAESNSCDFLLLGGDLFHDHSPSKYVLHKTMELLNRYTIGITDHKFMSLSNNLNFLNPSLNIKMPIFIIHGNHDDPSAESNISAIHLMESAHFLNYFSCNVNEEKVVVKPLVFQKMDTCLYLYGLGNVKEERLNRMFKEGKVEFEKPEDEKKAVFLLVVHQNRYKGSGQGPHARNCVLDWVFPDFFDLVIWGHEHDSFTEPRTTENKGYRIFQPGSTVATSLTEGEARQKHMFLLEVRKLSYKMTPVPITQTRQIIYKNIDLRSLDSNDTTQAVTELFYKALEEADQSRPLLPPLVRFKIEVTGQEDFPGFHLNSLFSEKTANKDVLSLWKRDVRKAESLSIIAETQETDLLEIIKKEVNSLKASFQILNPLHWVDRVQNTVVKNDSKSIEEFFELKLNQATSKILENLRFRDQEEVKRRVRELNILNDDPK